MERNVVVGSWLLAACFWLCGQSVMAQSEGGLLLGAEVEKPLSQNLSLNVEAAFRSRNDFKTADRWSGSLGVEYKLTKGLKANVGYTLLYDNYREKLTDSYWRPSYWGTRHRFSASLTGSRKIGKVLRLSLRERWQYTYRPETTTDRYEFVDYPSAQWTGSMDGWTATEKVRDGKGKNQLRSRLQVEYDKKKANIKPHASVELYNSLAIEKVRYTVGADIKLSKQHSLDLYYRFQDQRHVDANDYEPDMHYIGASYKYKF
jgi:hypothetical protein